MFALIFYIASSRESGVKITDTNDFKAYVDRCIKLRAEYSLYKLGYAGGDLGYSKMFKHQYTETTYALYGEDKFILPLDLVEKQLEDDVLSEITKCINQFPNN